MKFKEAPIGAVFDVRNGATPASENPAFWDGDISWVGPVDLGQLTVRHIEHGKRSITHAGYTSCGTQLVPPGTILLSTRAPIGHVAIASREICFNQGCRGLVPRNAICSDFAYWALLARIPQLEAAGQGTTFLELSRDKLKAARIPLPDLPTQKAIADFLDRETARIDQLIEKKQRLVEVLGEKRQVVISHAVTKGLDPSVRMQESCVEWIGALPESSGVRRGKFMFREGNARSKTGGEELLSVSHVTGVTRRSEKNVYMFLAESNEDYKLVTTGDVVVNTMWAWMGAIGVSPIDGLISPSYGVYAPTGNHYVPQYLELLLRSRPFVAEVNRRSKGVWSSRLRLYPDAFLDISFPVPSREDQAKTLSALAYATKRESTLGELGARSIDRLREFRSALITAAVTGEIDVSTWGKQRTIDRRLDQIEEAASA